ncbi:hypothetical protein WEI85_19830 [Actinomycetes bacterium KLBMP 9797]
MAGLTLRDPQPVFAVERRDDGAVVLSIEAAGSTVHLVVGRAYADASLLAQSLRHLAEDLSGDILDGWADVPDDHDGFIGFEHGHYHAKLAGSALGIYATRQEAEADLAAAMARLGLFPNAWYLGGYGGPVDITDTIHAHARRRP